MRLVAALGGNALLRRGEKPSADVQHGHLREAAGPLATIASDHDLVVTHGNGPQIGLLALLAESAGDSHLPLDILGAESEGWIGYMIEQELRNRLPDRAIATLLTLVVVAADDPAFKTPTKPVGPVYSRQQALEDPHGWDFAPENGDGAERYRRVVASPLPQEIVNLSSICLLLEGGNIVICAGGGGIPVIRAANSTLNGIEAVIDKDFTAALLARQLDAEKLLLLTDVDAACTDWQKPGQRKIKLATPDRLEELEFAAGSMAPKVAAACDFVRNTGRSAAIGALQDASALIDGNNCGTHVVSGSGRLEFYPHTA